MKFQKIGHLTAAASLVLAAMTGMQAAHATDWSFGGLTSGSIYTTGAGLSLSGLSTANVSTATSTAYATAGSASFTTANVYSWGGSGLGIVKPTYEASGAAGPHAFDNVVGTDAIVIGFGGTKVNLSSLQIGWNGWDNCTADGTGGCGTSSTTGKGTEVTATTGGYKGYNDSDLSVFAWMGTGTPTTTPTMAALTGATSVTNGWKLIGNYADVGKQGSNTQALASSVYSSNWLISAYNSNYGSTNSGYATGTLGGFNDAFKLLAVSGGSCTQDLTGNSCGPGMVPEPGGLALLGLGLVGLITIQNARRRRANGGSLTTIS